MQASRPRLTSLVLRNHTYLTSSEVTNLVTAEACSYQFSIALKDPVSKENLSASRTKSRGLLGPEGRMVKVDSIHPGPFHFLNHHTLKKKKKVKAKKTIVKRPWGSLTARVERARGF